MFHLDLSGNDLRTAQWDNLIALPSLKKLVLEHCHLSSLPLPTKIPRQIKGSEPSQKQKKQKKNVKYVKPKTFESWNLAHNSIAHLTGEECLTVAPFAVELDLSFNPIGAFPPEFRQLDRLRLLKLSHSSLSSIAHLPLNLRVLDLHRVELKSLPDDCFTEFRQLIELRLSHNNLVVLPTSLGLLQHLQRLHLWRNQLRELPSSICELHALTELYCHRCQLSSLPSQLFVACPLLKVLNLAYNQLVNLPTLNEDTLRHCAILNISHNKLRQWPVVSANQKILPGVEELFLRGNLLTTCECAWEGCGRLKILDLGQNCLMPSIPASIGQIHGLRDLLLDANQLVTLPKELSLLPNIRSFNAFGNTNLQQPPYSLLKCGRLQIWEYLRAFDTPH